MTRRKITAFIFGLLIFPLLHTGSTFALANSEVERLQNQITQKNNRLSEIEAEIAEYEKALTEVGAEKSTLQKAINQLDLERRKVRADISYTENKITSTDLEINKLILEISATEKDIQQNEEAIKSILREMNIADNDSMVEILLRHKNLSEFWNEFETLETVKNSMRGRVAELSILKDVLEEKRDENTERRADLVDLKNQYSDQNAILYSNQINKEELLSVTKSEEENYQTLLSQQKAARDKLLAEVAEIESELQFILDPNTIPPPGTPVFRWPLDNVYITQYFGYTKFALSGAYNGSQHNGVDFGAPIGTKLYAPLTGTVRNVGNTDAVPGCYSWGKWLLIDHPNGLSSMFAHMSQISVSPGQKVKTGDIVGYVGSTGYSTGPHLHYTLYVTDAVNVMQFNQFKSVTGCGAALSPFAAIEGYLNPLDYLPRL
jgi:murein DD-endopeptidase MepM/ murein hydrolase activator NlpD